MPGSLRMQRWSQSNRSGFETGILESSDTGELGLNPTVVVLKPRDDIEAEELAFKSQSNRSGFET